MRNFVGNYEPGIPVSPCQVCGRGCQSARAHYDEEKKDYVFENICLVCQDLTGMAMAIIQVEE
ncbi:MAG: hypothetical protein ABFD89_30080 [Bryobacteraceae bacterium]